MVNTSTNIDKRTLISHLKPLNLERNKYDGDKLVNRTCVTFLIIGYRIQISTYYSKNVQIRFYSNKGNNKITELRTILQRESQNS
jgi:hypothetical protein